MKNNHIVKQTKSLVLTDVCPAEIDALPVAVFHCLADEMLTFCWGNACFFSSIGYPPEEYRLTFHALRQYYIDYPEDFNAITQAVSHALQHALSHIELTTRMPLKTGGTMWVRFNATLTPDAKDERPALQAVLTNVDALVQEAEEKTRLYKQHKQYIQWMIDASVSNIYISDMDTYELLYLNQLACGVLGRNAHELIGRKCYEVIQGRTSPCPFCTNDRLTEDAFYEWEFFNPRLDRTFMIKNRLMTWDGHRARIELSHDTYSVEYKLAKKDREREALMRSLPGAFARLDARDLSTILWYGDSFLDIIGYTAQQFIDELHSQCTYIYPEDLSRILAMVKDFSVTGENIITEVRVLTRTGETKILTITLSYTSAQDSWDGIPSFYSVGIDITKERNEQMRQRKALEEAYELVQVASDAKTNFLSTMSHDIRTPMNAIMGMAVIAQANLTDTGKVHDCLTKINLSSKHLLNLINEILDMSKIESGKIDLTAEETDLSELVQNVIDMCQPLIAEKKHHFQVCVSCVRHEKVVTDASRLQQIFMNLLSNAIKYTPEGGEISLKVQELPSHLLKKGQYEFIFTDNGIGMSEEFLHHIFEPFARADDSQISQIQGTGLGLAITKNIVRMMNGTINVKSRPGKGSQFILSLPFELCDVTEECETELAGLSVLVVDDEQAVCESAAALLNELGMRGYWVLSGAEAIRCTVDAHKNKDDFFAVILDWKMPEMDGFETLKAIRRELGANVPIIIVSAYDFSSLEEEFKQAGADAFITKPLFKSKMLHVFHLFLQTSRSDAVSLPPKPRVSSFSGKKVLLAEDNELNREIALELLQMNGLAVDTAENGQRAVEFFAASAPGDYACILMDIQMPVMNGYDATQVIRELDRKDAQTVPILALTANAFASDLGIARNVGMDDHIAKPIDVENLCNTLQKWIR